MVHHLTVNMQITKIQKRKIFRISFILTCLVLSFTQGDEWQSGSYGLPKPKSGCPGGQENGWREGWRYQDMEDSNKSTSERSRVSIGSHMRVTLVGLVKDVRRTFCMKQNTGTQTRFWPKGSYCIYKSGTCPKDMTSGGVRWDDEDNNNKNRKGGFLPDGSYNQDTVIEYCCQTDGNWYDSIELPVSQPFYLLTSSSTDTPKCQIVKWALSYLEYIVFDTEDNNNKDSQGGEHLFLDGEKKYYCYYEDCRHTVTGRSGSFRSHKAAVSEMDPRSQYCSWLITLAEKYIISLSFKEMTIPSCNDTFLRIYDGSTAAAPLLGTYCGSNASAELVDISSFTNSLYIVSNSGSYGRSAKNTFYAQYNVENSRENQPSKLPSVRNNGSSVSKTVTTISAISTTPGISTTPAILPSCCSEGEGSRMIIIAATAGGVVFLCIVLIVLLIRYKRRKRAPKLSTPVNIPLADATPQESLPIDQEPLPGYENVASVNREFYDDVSAEGSV